MTHTRAEGFIVLPTLPALRVTKNVDVLFDPINGAVNPRQIPGQHAAVSRDGDEHRRRHRRREHARDCRPRAGERRARRRGRPRQSRGILRRHRAERLDVRLPDERRRSRASPAARRHTTTCPCRTATASIRTSRRCASRRAARWPAPRAATTRASASSFASACADAPAGRGTHAVAGRRSRAAADRVP